MKDASYEKSLRADIRRWTAERDEYLDRTAGKVTAQSERCQAIVDEARAELARLKEERCAQG